MISKSAADTKTGRVEDAGKFARMAKFFLAIVSSSVKHPLENSIIVQVRVPVPRTIYNLNNSQVGNAATDQVTTQQEIPAEVVCTEEKACKSI